VDARRTPQSAPDRLAVDVMRLRSGNGVNDEKLPLGNLPLGMPLTTRRSGRNGRLADSNRGRLQRRRPQIGRDRHRLKTRSGSDLLPLTVTQPDRNNLSHVLPRNRSRSRSSRSSVHRTCARSLLASSTRRTASAASQASRRRRSAFNLDRLDASLWHSEHHDDNPSSIFRLDGNSAASFVTPQCRHRFSTVLRPFPANPATPLKTWLKHSVLPVYLAKTWRGVRILPF
jgi:hypothetical protein